MARQTYYLTREQKHPLYNTRMLAAGPIELDGSTARLYRKLGVDLSDEAPKRAAAPKTEAEPVRTEAAKPKAAPKAKRPARKKAAAKK